MPDRKEIEALLKKTGFRCMMCGDCCRENTPDSNLILISAEEVRDIIAATGMKWDEVADPYPDFFEAGGCSVTLAWCLKRKGGQCIFLNNDNRCRIYKNRPWICRTYPFMLTDEALIVSECKNQGLDISGEEAKIQADTIIERKENEEMEFQKIKMRYENADISKIKKCVIDSEGVKEIE